MEDRMFKEMCQITDYQLASKQSKKYQFLGHRHGDKKRRALSVMTRRKTAKTQRVGK